jgi:transposase
MSAITLDGKLYMIEQERSFKGEDVVRFLKHLMGQIPDKLLLIWDGSPIHRGGAVKDFLASEAASRVQLEQLPGYAPDLNPDEGIWKHLKCVELKNLCCQSLAQLSVELRKAKERRSYIQVTPVTSTKATLSIPRSGEARRQKPVPGRLLGRCTV